MDIAQLQQQAFEYLEQGQYSNAIALYQQCVDTNPTSLSNYWYLGLALLLQGEELEAQAIWVAALARENPKEIDVCLAELLKILEAEAIQHLESGNAQVAERIYWQILELNSNSAETYYNLGNAIACRGDLDEAAVCWQRATELKPDFADAYQSQGYVLQKQDRFEEAIPRYLKVLELKPDWTEAYYNLGICFYQQDKLDEAIACFQKAVHLKPDYTQAYGDWGGALLEQGKLDEAIACFQMAIQLKPAFAQAYWNWRNALAEQGKSNEVINSKACFLKALQAQTELAEVYLYLGNALASQKKFDKAIACYGRAIWIQPNFVEAYLELGKALAQQGEWDEAIASYQEVLQVQPDSAEAYLGLGKALAQQGKLDEAIATYHSAVEINPSLAEVYLYLGNVLAASGKLDEAIAFYQKKLEIQPDSADAYTNLGIALAHRSKYGEAIACFQKAIEIEPELAELIYNVMMALCQQGRLNEADAYFQKVLPVDPPNNFYELTCDWAVKHSLDVSNYIDIYPKNQIYLTPPRTPDKTIHFSFRFGSQVELPATFVVVLPKGRYWLDRSQTQSAVITSANKLLADVSPDFPVLSPGHPDKHPSRHLVFSSKKLPPVQKIDGTVAVLSGLLNNIYFHWMFDVLPRIELLRLSGIEMTSIDYFLINSRDFLSFHKETLDVLKIPDIKRLCCYQHSHIEAARLIVPSFPGSIAWMPKWACVFLRSTFLSKTTEKTEKIERIYISRENATSRRVTNEKKVIRFLDKFGFKSINLETFTVMEQATLLADAKVVVASHGSGLTNVVFCRPETKIIEIFPPNYIYPCYWLVSNMVGLEYYYLLGESVQGFYLDKLLDPSPGIEDIFVNLASLYKVMRLAEVV